MPRDRLRGPPPRSTGPAKTLYTALSALGRYLNSADLSLADVFGNSDDVPPAEPALTAGRAPTGSNRRGRYGHADRRLLYAAEKD